MVKRRFLGLKKLFSGDSIVEVLIAVAIFSAIAVSALGIMNQGLKNAQSALETTIARTELVAQAERIRFLADSYNTDPNTYGDLWNKVATMALNYDKDKSASDKNYYNQFLQDFKSNESPDCRNVINKQADYRSFLIKNSDQWSVFGGGADGEELSTTDSTPGENNGGLFIVAYASDARDGDEPEYYDFYVNACWSNVNSSLASKLSTTIRIQNPKLIQPEPIHIRERGKGTLKIVYHWALPREDRRPVHNQLDWLTGYQGYDVFYSTDEENTDIPTAIVTYNETDPTYSFTLANIDPGAYDGNEYEFEGWYKNGYVSAEMAKNEHLNSGFECETPIDINEPYNCKWKKESGLSSYVGWTNEKSDTIDLYGKWKRKDKYLFCVKYNLNQNNLPVEERGGNIQYDSNIFSSSFTSDGSTLKKGFFEDSENRIYCEERLTNSDTAIDLVGNDALTSETGNYKNFGWRGTDSYDWGDRTYYYNDSYGHIYKLHNNKVETTSISDDSKLPIKGDVFYRYSGVYYADVYPQWRANIKTQEDEIQCKKGKFIDFDWFYGYDSECTKKKLGGGYEAKASCSDNGNCPITAVVSYRCEEGMISGVCSIQDTNKKFLDAMIRTNRETKTISYLNPSIRQGRKLYVKLEHTSDEGDGNYNTEHRLNKNGTTVYSTMNMLTGGDYGIFYYSILSSKNTDKYRITNSDNLRINYILNGGNTGAISIQPESEAFCWHAFALDSSDGSLYIVNATDNSSSNNTCGTTFDLGIPF